MSADVIPLTIPPTPSEEVSVIQPREDDAKHVPTPSRRISRAATALKTIERHVVQWRLQLWQRFTRSMEPRIHRYNGIVYRPDPEPKALRRQAALSFVLAAFFLASAMNCFLSQGFGYAPHLGISRIVAFTVHHVPVMQIVGRWMIGLEQAMLAIMLAYVALALLRSLAPPLPRERELVPYYSRQSILLRWRWLAVGSAVLALGLALSAWPELLPLPATTMMRLTALQLHLLVGGVLELLGAQWLFRFLFFARVPYARAYVVVVTDPLGHGLGNRIVVGDGAFSRMGHIVIRHDELLAARVLDLPMRRTLLGLAALEITYQDGQQVKRLTIDSPGSVTELRSLEGYLNGPFVDAESLSARRSPLGKNASIYALRTKKQEEIAP
jgi:hypothetical protein